MFLAPCNTNVSSSKKDHKNDLFEFVGNRNTMNVINVRSPSDIFFDFPTLDIFTTGPMHSGNDIGSLQYDLCDG